MRAAVLAAFPAFTTQFEGRLAYMYLDALGLVTTGVGNLIDPLPLAMSLPWLNADGSKATSEQIEACWNAVKARTDLDQKGGAIYSTVPENTLRLTSQAIDQLVKDKLTANEAELKPAFPNWENFPADGQMGILSMAWAMGAGFAASWPHFVAAVNGGDWATAATQSQMAPSPGIAPRNAADLQLFTNAAGAGSNPGTLFYPGTPSAPGTLSPGAVAADSPSGAGSSLATWLVVSVLAAAGAGATWWMFFRKGA